MAQNPRKIIFIVGFAVLLIGVVGGWFLWKRPTPKEASGGGGEIGETKDLGNGISVTFVNSSYKAADGKTSGFFKTGQDADMMLSGVDFNNAGGPLLFNHPGGIASDGKHLLLADRNNNRVLIWNKLPTGNTEPDLVLGQKNSTTNNPGTGMGEMNWPVALATDGKRVIVADTENDRLLIWNKFPTKSGQAADMVIKDAGNVGPGQANLKRKMGWPWAVWTNGKKLVVTSTASSLVLIWNKFPTKNNEPADIILNAKGKFGTPRSIGSDGKHLVIGDHNSKVNNGRGTFFWKTFPTKDDQSYDFFIANPAEPQQNQKSMKAVGDVLWQPAFTPQGQLIGLGNLGLHIWNKFPKNASDASDLNVGAHFEEGGGYYFEDGDGSGVVLAGGKLYLSVSNGNKIVVYNSIPTSADQKPDFAIGTPDIDTNTLETSFIISNPVPASDGTSLFVSSDFDKTLHVWKKLPGESGARPDLVYTLAEGPWDNALYGETFALAGKKTVYVWKELPTEGQAPDLIFENSIGNAQFNELGGVAIDAKYFYLADTSANKVYVWEGIPKEDSNPKFTISTEKPYRLSSDGSYLVVTRTLTGPGGSVQIYSLSGNKVEPVKTLEMIFNLPQGATVSHGHLFVGDTDFHRVVIWKDIKDAIAGKPADVVLGADKVESNIMPEATQPRIGKDTLFKPAVPFFDGKYLWVGEFKFSERLLRFSPQ